MAKPNKSKGSKVKKSKVSKTKKNHNSKNVKCDKDYTYSSTVSGYIDIKDGLSNASINQSKKLYNRVKIYKQGMYRVHDCMKKLYEKVQDTDKKEDLRIMLNNYEIFIENVEKGIKL